MAQQEPQDSRGGFLHAVKTIGWAFFGVRGKRGHDRDLARLKPIHVISVGLLIAIVFVLTLLLVARYAAA